MAHTHTTPSQERFKTEPLGIFYTLLPIVGIIALVITFVGGLKDKNSLAFSWLFASQYFYTIAAGSLFWVLLHHALDTNWTVVPRRILETITALFPLLAVAYLITAVFFAPYLWEWMHLQPGEDVLYDHKKGFLNEPFFFARFAFYFIFLTSVAYFLRWKSIDQDSTNNPWNSLSCRKVAYPSIFIFALTLTFSAFDWLMGLNFKWFSTMWGVYIFAGSVWSSMALLILISNLLYAKGYLRGVFSVTEHNHIMGKLLLAFTIFWAYIAFSQYFLIWYANIPEETEFFLIRNTDNWVYVSVALVTGHFVIPFLWLLTQPAKRVPWRICTGAIWVLAMHMLDMYWIIIPARQFRIHEETGAQMSILPSIFDITAIIGIGCLLAFAFLWLLSRSALFPVHDPRLQESINLKN